MDPQQGRETARALTLPRTSRSLPKEPDRGSAVAQQDAKATRGASRRRPAAVGPRGSARPQREKAAARPPRRPPRDTPRLRPAPPPPRRDSARACAVRGFRATGVLRGTGSAPGRTEKACKSLGLGDSGTRGAGRLICLSESEKSSEPQDYSSTHAYCNRLGAREAERTAAVAERRQSLPGRGGAVGEKAPNSKCSAGAFRGRVLGAKRSTLLGEGKRKSSFSFSYFLRRENLETCRQQ